MAFETLGLSEFLLRALERLGYAEATPIQREAIPRILEGGDVLAAAQTGSGKTAAFVLPILQRLSETGAGLQDVRALIVVPTRELAVQVGASVERYGQFLPEKPGCAVVYGGVGYEAQIQAVKRGASIGVATPGRLLDLVNQGALDLSRVEVLVLDEADRLLALGFADELNAVLGALPPKRQNLLFSATFPPSVVGLAEGLLRDPARVQLESESRPVESIAQRAIEVERTARTALLRHLIEVEDWSRVLVFVGSKRRADNVAAKLVKRGIRAAALHGDLSQDKRSRALERFKQGKTRVLMATDVASRGIDIAQLPCVVNYDLPRSPADYVHRIGRTGRAGASGVAITFISQEDHHHFALIEKRNRLRLERERIEGFIPPTWDPDASAPPSTKPVKGKRKRKKDKLREAKAREQGGGVSEADVSGPWAHALRRSKGS